MTKFNFMKKSIAEIINKLPKTKEANLHLIDPAVFAFVRLIAETDEKDIDKVIDEIFVYYTKRSQTQLNMLNEYLQYGIKPEDLSKLISSSLKKE